MLYQGKLHMITALGGGMVKNTLVYRTKEETEKALDKLYNSEKYETKKNGFMKWTLEKKEIAEYEESETMINFFKSKGKLAE